LRIQKAMASADLAERQHAATEHARALAKCLPVGTLPSAPGWVWLLGGGALFIGQPEIGAGLNIALGGYEFLRQVIIGARRFTVFDTLSDIGGRIATQHKGKDT
jgi:hypothetical protein